MKYLTIPDVHQRIPRVEAALNYLDYDQVVFLGDIFDSRDPESEIYGFERTCKWYRQLLHDGHYNGKPVQFLIGNHDMLYIASNNRAYHTSHPASPLYPCSGWTRSKLSDFRKVFYSAGLADEFFKERLKPVLRIGDWVLSHAGIHPRFLRSRLIGEEGPELSADYLIDEAIPDAWDKFREPNHPYHHLLSNVGYCRFGPDPVGGILWQDWNEEFTPSDEIGNQIVGHTIGNHPRQLTTPKGTECWNLDTTNHYGILEQNQWGFYFLTTHRYDEIPSLNQSNLEHEKKVNENPLYRD